MAKIKEKVSGFVSTAKKYWDSPSQGNYIPYREVANISAAGFGRHWTSLLASEIALSASNFLVGASIGLKPVDLQIMLTVANLVGIPIAFFRGWYFDNHNMKGGKFLPFIIRSIVPIFAISTVFVWLPYEDWNYITKAVVVWFFYMILQFFLCFYNEGFEYFQQVITPNAQERANVMSITQIIYSLAPSVTNLVVPTIAGRTYGIDNIWTYRLIYPAFTVIGLVISLIFFRKLKERIILPKKRKEYVRTWDALREVAKNKYFWIVNSANWIVFLESACGVILSWTFVYAYNGAKDDYLGLVNTIMGNAGLWSMMVTPFLIKKLGKRNLLIVHNICNIILLSFLYPFYQNIVVLCVIFYINTFLNTFGNIYFPNIKADMRDYHQWKTGVRVDGLFGTVGLIGTPIGFFTGMIIPYIYEINGIKEDYSVLHNDALRNNLFEVLIICSIIGACLNLIPYLFYDLTESKHKGYVKVLKIRAMFSDFADGNLDDAQLHETMDIINEARAMEGADKKTVDKTALKAARSLPKSTDEEKELRRQAIKAAKAQIKAVREFNSDLESLPIVVDELNKFNTKRYMLKLEAARRTVANGLIYEYDGKAELQTAKDLPHSTKEEKEIRADAMALARTKAAAQKVIRKYGAENIVKPDEKEYDKIQEQPSHTLAQALKVRRALKDYADAQAVYIAATLPYENARTLIEEAQNFARFDEIERIYKETATPVV